MFLTDKEMRESPFPLDWDNTMLSLPSPGGGCSRKFYWFWRGADYRFTPSYFTYGKAYQEALSTWYSVKGKPSDRYVAALNMAQKTWADDGGGEGQGVNSLDKLLWLITFYIADYPKETWEVITYQDQVELGFVYPLLNTPYRLAGAIDGYLNWNPHGILNLENKTVGTYLNEKINQWWRFSTQITQYQWGLWKIAGKLPFGSLMNVGSKMAVTDKAIKEFQTTGHPPTNTFSRTLEKRTPYELEEFEKDCLRIIEDMEREWERWEWPKTRSYLECTGGYGRTACPYRRLCSLPIPFADLDEDTILGTELKWREEPWRPWERGGKEKPLIEKEA